MITTNIVFDHRGRTAKGADGPVEIRVTVDRKPYYINTGVRIPKHRLKAGVVVGNGDSYDADALNKRLRLLVGLVLDEINECLASGRVIDVKAVRDKINRVLTGKGVERKEDEQTIVEWIREQVPLMGVSVGRAKHYATLRTRLLEYGGIMHWRDLTVENIYKWDAWLHGLKTPVSENQRRAGLDGHALSQGVVYNYHKNLKAMLYRAVKLGVIERNPYDRMKGEFRRGDNQTVRYLTKEELTKIEGLILGVGTQLAMARDIFVFQAYTGLSFGDAQNFDIKNYRQQDGRWVAIGQRIKTGVPYVSMLLPQAVAVLERNGWRVPQMPNQKCNMRLKTIGRMAGVEGLHSHMARHTFATMALAAGAKIENVSRMLGHTNIKQTQRYAKVLAENVYSDYEKMEIKLK